MSGIRWTYNQDGTWDAHAQGSDGIWRPFGRARRQTEPAQPWEVAELLGSHFAAYHRTREAAAQTLLANLVKDGRFVA